MMPIGPLMIEHRLIEQGIRLLAREKEEMRHSSHVRPDFIYSMVDFLRTYADRTHHGKEEDILFRELSKKRISEEHRQMMAGLIADHAVARKTVQGLVTATQRHGSGEDMAIKDIIEAMSILTGLYPEHIRKEDKEFFMPVMGYFSETEQQIMLQESYEFDRTMIHEKYKKMIEQAGAFFR